MRRVAVFGSCRTFFFFPPLPNRASLFDQLFRAIWHFLPARNKLGKLIFPYSGADFSLLDTSQILTLAKVYLSRDFDPDIARYAQLYSGSIDLIETRSTDLTDIDSAYFKNVKGIIIWDTSDPKTVSAATRIADLTGAELVWADPSSVQQETLVSIRFAYQFFEQKELEELVNKSYQLFRDSMQRWREHPISAFGNGPSLSDVVDSKFDTEVGLTTVCNSTISDQLTLSLLKPKILFCGDPVQHCGPSLYAGQFRKGLAKAMEDPSRVLITQLGYVPYFQHVVSSDARNRIIGVGNDRRAVFNINLENEFITASTANIFTMLVLPVILTLSKNINIYGCDGMSFRAATKPWSHANEDDYMGKMAVTHRVHPGFWKRNYEEEFWSYCNDMEDILSLAEANGATIRSATPSYVPALAKRFRSNSNHPGSS